MDIQEVGREALEWINLDWDRDNWWTFVSVVMKFPVPWNAGISWLAEDLLASSELLSSMDTAYNTIHLRFVSGLCLALGRK